MSIRVERLSKSFKTETVLNDVSFDVPKGEILVLFGPSGAGKTVLLRCIAGAVEPDSGHVWLNGEDATALPPEDRGLGMAFQNFALFPHMSAEKNIGSPLEARRTTRENIAASVRRVAELLKIDHVLSHAPRELSNGQKQRTALARALVAEPDLLLLDDPLCNVDAKLRFEMRLELPRLLADRGATVIYVTQDYKEAMAFGRTIAVLEAGRIAQTGTPEDIYFRPATQDISQLFGDPAINLLDVTPQRDEQGVFVSLSEFHVHLPPGYEETVGQPAVLGVRPEAIWFAEEGIPVDIEAENPFNEKMIALTKTLRGREIVVSRPAGQPGPSGGKAKLSFEGRATLLFDKATGTRISPASSKSEAAA
ncbi:MAG: ABC transporter ATP-binding protein [Rhodospirillales bacterium]|nr:ABC transporter ATP-binding protein [Rhodospirillales bacterium]